MGLDRRLIAAAAVIAAVVFAAALFALSHRGGGSGGAGSTPSANTTKAGVEKAPSIQECGSGNVLAVVYADGQEKLAEKIAGLLAQQLRGHLPPDTRYCVAPAGASGLGDARVLPLILVKASNASAKLRSLLLNQTVAGGFHPVRYDVDAVFAVRVALQYHLPQPVYNAKTVLVITEPRSSVARLNPATLEKQKQLLSLIEAVAAAKIERVVALGNVSNKLHNTRPNLVFMSSSNLSDGDPALQAIGRNLYEARQVDFARVFMQRGLTEAMEIEESADALGLSRVAAEHPTIGGGETHLAIFEDFMCPFCARFYRDTLPTLEKLAKQGSLEMHFMDLIVHRQGVVPKLHRLLLCYYLETGNATGYLEAAKKIYSLLYADLEKLQQRKINETTLVADYNKLYQELEKQLGASPNCTKADRLLAASQRIAAKLGITGTPGFAAWRSGSNYVVVTEGYRTPAFFNRLLESLEK